MASNDAHGHHGQRAHEQGPQPAREPVEDALGRLEERLDRASRAAERLLADAAGRMVGEPEPGETDTAAEGEPLTPPPAGWQQTQAGHERGAPPLLADADLLLALFAAVRNRIPPDLQQRLGEAIREVLLALRALIDWYLERSERARSGPTEVQDIPIL
ncbi:MAG TPA: hypothetical protein VGG07_26290 [Solirubrobacteraceae bacterium]|jgi:hypothetical protein|nr:hypothetical protein [Solirubrobacteraceae bacterium]